MKAAKLFFVDDEALLLDSLEVFFTYNKEYEVIESAKR